MRARHKRSAFNQIYLNDDRYQCAYTTACIVCMESFSHFFLSLFPCVQHEIFANLIDIFELHTDNIKVIGMAK